VLRPRVFVLLLICTAVGCSLPATTLDAYRSKAVDAAEEATSQARTAILTAHLVGRDRLLLTSAAVQLQEAEAATAAAVETFASVQPPDRRADRLRARILPVLERISDLLSRMRFEARREDTTTLLALRSALIEPADALHRWATANG
jgi:hypothetical protein